MLLALLRSDGCWLLAERCSLAVAGNPALKGNLVVGRSRWISVGLVPGKCRILVRINIPDSMV